MKIESKVALIYPFVHLVQRCDRDMDFEALLIHTGQEVALNLEKNIHIYGIFVLPIFKKKIKYLFCYLLIIELIEAEQVIKADNLVILNHL